MSRLRRATLAAALLAAAGCGQRVVTPQGARIWADSYVFGTLGRRDFDVRSVCGARGARSLQVLPTPETVVVSVATLGMYTPREVRVACR